MAIKHRIRQKGGKTKVAVLTARGAIMENCKECMGFVTTEVKRCTDTLCPLFPFRTREVPKGVV